MRIDPSTLDLKEKVVFINRVTKVVKGGRNFRFSALVVVGDENGHVGVGMGKSIEIPEAIKKGIEDAKKNMVSVAIVGTTVPHEIYGKSKGMLNFYPVAGYFSLSPPPICMAEPIKIRSIEHSN